MTDLAEKFEGELKDKKRDLIKKYGSDAVLMKTKITFSFQMRDLQCTSIANDLRWKSRNVLL